MLGLVVLTAACSPARKGEREVARARGEVRTLDQGVRWTDAQRQDFYGRDQGSRLMPVRWLRALTLPDGAPLMADGLARYGYLRNPWSEFPIGFTLGAGDTLGMTCAACHTREIEVDAATYRIDGGPAIVDFQRLLADLDASMGAALATRDAFDAFARRVLGASATPAQHQQLRTAVDAWYVPFHTIVSRSLPTPPWGPARLDAVSMIFNRVAGLDIGASPNRVIPSNIARADAPVRYPFLWNAPIQDTTQWPGFAGNGNAVLALARNLGEVYGVFGVFQPTMHPSHVLGIDYLKDNSADFAGLLALEDLVKRIGPPRWPWNVDRALAEKGKAVFESDTAGGCAGCHGIAPGMNRFPNLETWKTPVHDVGTDGRQYEVLKRPVDTGVLAGAKIPFFTDPLDARDQASRLLRIVVVGSILQHFAPGVAAMTPFIPETETLRIAFPSSAQALAVRRGSYESRVLQGIWATAPYLHNGSVPSLAELLKPPAERVAAFQVGPAYDPVDVGLAATQPKFGYTLTTTDCNDRDSGNSRCGHEFGTTLSADDKRALLEYLKTL